jgi:hypothetical protein
VLVVLSAIAYQNRDIISKLLADQATPGPAKACKAYLAAVALSRAYAAGPAAVRSALAQAQRSLTLAMFVNWVPSAAVQAELKSLGMSDEDLAILRTIAPLSPEMMSMSLQ